MIAATIARRATELYLEHSKWASRSRRVDWEVSLEAARCFQAAQSNGKNRQAEWNFE